jgi:hypothetical protein
MYEQKKQKKKQKNKKKGFSYYFCMIIEGSGSGFIPLTNGYGSGRSKNMLIRWIRIRIRIHNTAPGYLIMVLTVSTHLQGWFVPAAVGCVERPAAAEISSSAGPVCSSHI